MKIQWRWFTKLVFVGDGEDIFIFGTPLILEFLIKYLAGYWHPGDNSCSSHRRLRGRVGPHVFYSNLSGGYNERKLFSFFEPLWPGHFETFSQTPQYRFCTYRNTLLSNPLGQMMKTLQDLLSERHCHNKGTGKQKPKP